MKNNKVKILVGYHKPDHLIGDDVFIPIHLGRKSNALISKDGTISAAEYDWMIQNMIGDDTGDNISHLNRNVCELSGIYWGWKNYNALGNPDYFGFSHYRRLFIGDPNFCMSQYAIRRAHYANTPCCDSFEYMKDILRYPDVVNFTDNYDVVIPEELNIHSLSPKLTRLRDSYGDLTQRPEDCEWVLNYISDKHPRFAETAEDCIASHYLIPFNMFIARKDIFFEYCYFLFDIVFAMMKEFSFFPNDIFKSYGVPWVSPQNPVRSPAFMGELISTFFFKQLLKERKLRIRRQYICCVDGLISANNPCHKVNYNRARYKYAKYRIANILTLHLIPSFRKKEESYKKKVLLKKYT